MYVIGSSLAEIIKIENTNCDISYMYALVYRPVERKSLNESL